VAARSSTSARAAAHPAFRLRRPGPIWSSTCSSRRARSAPSCGRSRVTSRTSRSYALGPKSTPPAPGATSTERRSRVRSPRRRSRRSGAFLWSLWGERRFSSWGRPPTPVLWLVRLPSSARRSRGRSTASSCCERSRPLPRAFPAARAWPGDVLFAKWRNRPALAGLWTAAKHRRAASSVASVLVNTQASCVLARLAFRRQSLGNADRSRH